MPNRILKESICTNDQIDELTPFQETLFYRLIVKVDDFGRYDGRPKILKAALFPLKDNVKAADVKNAVDALAAAGLVRLYTVDGDPFVELTGWDRNQTIRAKKSKFPGSDEADVAEGAENTDSHTLENTCTQLHANANELNTSARKCSRNPNPNLNPIKEKDIERESPKRREVSKRPTLPEVAAFIEKNSLQVSAAAFMKYYESADWKTSAGNPVRDWKARVRMWAAESEDQKKKAAVNPNRFANFEQRDTDYNTLFGEAAS